MVDGFVKLGMGAKKVTPVPWKADGQAQPAAAAGNTPAKAEAAAPADKPAASAEADSNAAASK